MKALKNWLVEWLIVHGTEPVDRVQLGLFDMGMYYKAMRLGLLVENKSKNFDRINVTSVSLSDKGLEYVNDKKPS